MDLGVAGTIEVKEFFDYRNKDNVFVTGATRVNFWLMENPDIEVIDMKYTGKHILVIYRKEG